MAVYDTAAQLVLRTRLGAHLPVPSIYAARAPAGRRWGEGPFGASAYGTNPVWQQQRDPWRAKTLAPSLWLGEP